MPTTSDIIADISQKDKTGRPVYLSPTSRVFSTRPWKIPTLPFKVETTSKKHTKFVMLSLHPCIATHCIVSNTKYGHLHLSSLAAPKLEYIATFLAKQPKNESTLHAFYAKVTKMPTSIPKGRYRMVRILNLPSVCLVC